MAAFLADKFSVTKVSSSNFPNAGHCVGGCTYIYTDVGIRQIEDVVKEARAGTNVVNMNGEMENVSHFVPDGVRVVNTIKLVNGVVIDCTDSHKFYVWDSEKCDFVWIRSMDLDPSTNFFLFPKRVVLHERDLLDKSWHSQDKPNKKQISLPVSEESFAEYLGLLVGDGYYAKRTRVDIAFHTSQLDVMTKIQAMYSEMGIDNQYISQVGNKDCVVLSTSQCSGLMELFEHVGLEIATKDKKRTPSRVMASKPSVMGAYLRGLFDADGSVKTDRVTLSNCSESVIRDAQVILHALGISSFVTSYDDRRTDSPRMTQYCLSVSGTRNLSVFQERVGLLSKRKKELLNVLVESRQDLGPLIKINANIRVVSRQGGFRTESDSMRVSTIEHLASLGILFGPITIVARDYHVIGIDSIGFATKEIEVFDLTVPGTHSYLANGCIAHNTAQFEDGTKFVAKAIPTAAILKKVKGTGMQCWLSPGSGFSWDRLVAEWDEAGRPRIFVHGRASIVSEEHARRERQGSDSTKHIASTMQGSGTAISDKVLRRPDCLLAINDEEAMFDALQGMGAGDYVSILAPESFRKMTWEAIESGHTWLHEGSQGFALSIDHGSHFPFCLSGDSRVLTADGKTRKIRDIQVGDAVLAKDDAGRIVPKKVTNFWKNPTGSKKWFNVVTETSVYNRHDQQWVGPKLTGDHKVQTKRGKVSVQDLVSGDQVFTNEYELIGDGLQVFLGSMLGDGTVPACKKNRRRATLQISHGSAQRGYALAKASIMRGYVGGGERTLRYGAGSFKEGNEQVRYQSAASIAVMRMATRLGCYGSKNLNVLEIFSLIDERGLAIWYQDDGQRKDASNGQEVFLHTNGFSFACVEALSSALESKFDLHFSVYSVKGVKKHGRGDREYPVLRLSRKDHERWFAMVAPYVHPDLQHKLPEGLKAGWSTGWTRPGEMKCTTETVIDVVPSRSFRGQEVCFDIEVEDVHNFFVSNDKGAFNVENCTSRNCTLQSAMDHMAVPPALVGDVYLNLRTYPIRVGNVVEDGKQVGFSGDFYPDCEELTWEQVAERSGMPSDEAHRLAERERTTVTKRIRRVCTFTFDGLEQAVKTNGATKLCLNFVQYLDWKDNGLRGGPEAFKKLSKATRTLIDQIEEESGVKVVLIGTGADHEDMISLL